MKKVSEKLKRSFGVPLPKGWEHHHLNEDHSDDRVENLVALPKEIHDVIPTLEYEARFWQGRLARFQEALIDLSRRQRRSKRPCNSTEPFKALVDTCSWVRHRRSRNCPRQLFP